LLLLNAAFFVEYDSLVVDAESAPKENESMGCFKTLFSERQGGQSTYGTTAIFAVSAMNEGVKGNWRAKKRN